MPNPNPNPPSRVRVFGHPIHPMLVPFPITCFVGALVTDLVYWRTANMQWADFSFWLIAAGLVIGALAALAGITDFLSSRQIRAIRTAWFHGGLNAIAMILSLINLFVHGRGYASVVPAGLILSGVVVLILLVTGWLGGELVFRDRVAVAD